MIDYSTNNARSDATVSHRTWVGHEGLFQDQYLNVGKLLVFIYLNG